MIIEMIQKENDIKKLDHTQLKELAEEIRGFLLDKISCTGCLLYTSDAADD